MVTHRAVSMHTRRKLTPFNFSRTVESCKSWCTAAPEIIWKVHTGGTICTWIGATTIEICLTVFTLHENSHTQVLRDALRQDITMISGVARSLVLAGHLLYASHSRTLCVRSRDISGTNMVFLAGHTTDNDHKNLTENSLPQSQRYPLTRSVHVPPFSQG